MQRRAEILDTARRLFTTRGFQSTSVEDILTEVGIAKGTLYYHFSSKEEILRALIARTADGIADRARAIAEGRQPAVPKLLAIAAAARVDEPELELAEELHASGNAQFHILTIVEMVRALAPVLTDVVEQGIVEGVFSTPHPRETVEELHAPGNAEFHVLTIVETVRRLTPILTDVVEQGVAEGVFSTEHPRETIEILLTSAGMLLDAGIFTGEEAEIPRRAAGIARAAEALLGCEPGALAPIAAGTPPERAS